MLERKEFLKMPRSIWKEEFKAIIFTFFSTLLIDATAFFIQLSKEAVSSGKILLGIALLILHYAKDPLVNFFRMQGNIFENELKDKRDIALTKKAAYILFGCRDKVMQRNEEHGYNEKMSSGKILQHVKEYMNQLWKQETFVYKNVSKVISVLIVFLGLIKIIFTEVEEITFFSFLIVISIVLQCFCGKKHKNKKAEFESTMERILIKKDESKNEIYQTSMVNNIHKQYVLSNYYQFLKEEIDADRERTETFNMVKILERLLEAIVVCAFLVAIVIKTGIEKVDLLTILSAISVLEIYKRFMENVREIFNVYIDYQIVKERIQEKAKLCEAIFNVCESQNEKKKNIAKYVKSLELAPFNVGYSLDNDGAEKSFHLCSENSITLNNGDFVWFSGPSNSGKSTLMNIIIGNLVFDDITLNVNAMIPGEINTVIQDGVMQLGSNSVLEELTLGKTEYDHKKLIEILNALNLTQELTGPHEDILEYLAKINDNRFSDGQLQRLTIARTLFNVGDETHVIAFDEATSRLNDEIALQVTNYIKAKYKEVIVLFAGHQVNVLKQVATRRLNFEKIEDAMSTVREVEVEG